MAPMVVMSEHCLSDCRDQRLKYNRAMKAQQQQKMAASPLEAKYVRKMQWGMAASALPDL